jgi:hypothetical protein
MGPGKDEIPQAPAVHVLRTPVDGDCPECGAPALARYPVLAEIGWQMVVKCQCCLCSIQREPWHRLGPIELLIDRVEQD